MSDDKKKGARESGPLIKLKRLLVLLVALSVVICVAVVWAQVAKDGPGIKSPSSTSGGRYQLFQGQYTVNAAGTPFKEIGVFKINTETGQVWVYQEGRTKSGEFYKKWEAVGN